MSLPKRKNSLRLQGYDYSQSGAYFVTILAHRRLHLFGNIENEVVTLSKIGEIITSCWQQIPEHNPNVELDAHVIMPNHMHGILILHDTDGAKSSLSQIINTLKGAVTRIARKSTLNIDLEHPIWHRSFHDYIIRKEESYRYILNYVHTNPQRWDADEYS